LTVSPLDLGALEAELYTTSPDLPLRWFQEIVALIQRVREVEAECAARKDGLQIMKEMHEDTRTRLQAANRYVAQLERVAAAAKMALVDLRLAQEHFGITPSERRLSEALAELSREAGLN
jgi:hypothetical protein